MKSSASIFALGALAALALVSSHALAQTLQNPVVFETVDTYAIDSSSGAARSTINVTGLVQGTTTASTKEFSVDNGGGTASCDRMLATAMNRPGRFLVTIERSAGSIGNTCRLTRRP